MILNNKKLKELQSENEEYKALIQNFTTKEEKLKRFDELIKRARLEYADITQRKDQTAQTIEVLEADKTKLTDEIQKLFSEINQLRELKVAEQNQLLKLNGALRGPGKATQTDNLNQLSNLKTNLYKEIDLAEKRKNEIKKETIALSKKYDEMVDRIQEVKNVEQSLRREIERKKEEIIILIESHNAISEEQQEDFRIRLDRLNIEEKKITEETGLRIRKLSAEESDLMSRINALKNELKEIEQKNAQIIYESENKKPGESEENKIKKSFELLSGTETLKKELISELDDKISAKEAQLNLLKQDYKTKTVQLEKISYENRQLLTELQFRRDKLSRLNELMELTTMRLTDLDFSLDSLENEYSTLNKEVLKKKSTKAEIEEDLKKKTSSREELEQYLKELRETTTILAQLKNDIERGSGLSAKRFTGVLQYYSTLMTEMYKKKIHLEKMLFKKEKDVNEKDRLIEEKQLALDEIDKILFVGQSRVKLFEDLAKTIRKQREMLVSQVSASDDAAPEKIDIYKDQITSSALSSEKLLEFENALAELLKKSDKYLIEDSEKKTVSEMAIIEYDRRLNELNLKIRSSVNELSELRGSIDKIKAEHEEHRQGINKLVSIKKKLQVEINNQKTVIDKYEKIMQKIKEEQDSIRKKRESKDEREPLPGKVESKKVLDADRFPWMKS